ncbi:MAG TPA: hypothetical protein VE990_01790, partial [Acidimicrobiales bacterium]|nr:hypothetical protein [Acidimicrobiales bacterium]
MLTAAYGLDIETDTSRGGLDPRRCRIVAAALATEAYVVVMTGPEKRILANLDDKLARLPDGVLVTWNGSSFDLPFIADRAARLGLRLGLQLRLDPAIVRSHPPLA